MREYETFVYLDPQKTGTTFVARLLQDFCAEKLVRRRAHHAVGEQYDPKKFHFISVRNPLDQYVSLYSFGSEKKGPLYRKLVHMGHAELYDGSWRGFRSWLDFVLDPENAPLLSRTFGSAAEGESCRLIGLQSYRFLNLAVPLPKQLLADHRSRDAIRDAYNSQKIASFTIRHETFRADLVELLSTKLNYCLPNLDEALRYLETAEPINASDRVDRGKAHPRIGSRREDLLRDREWLLHETFGY